MKIGQRVWCIDGKRRREHGYGDETLPTEGQMYTIRAIDPLPIKGVRLEEIVNPVRLYREGYAETAFHYNRFAEVREENIEVFRAMTRELQPSN